MPPGCGKQWRMALRFDCCMKKILYVIMLALLVVAGCKKDKPVLTLSQKLCAEWRGCELSIDAAVYMKFASDGTFELYQKMSSEEFELRRGTWELDGDILSGNYNDEEVWSTSYKVSDENDRLTMVSLADGGETNIYTKTGIPAYIKENSTVVVKSACLL